jgi:Trk K+ transport system NAD-binding subunit
MTDRPPYAIVGGFGHLGRRIAAQLRACGHEVLVIDRQLDARAQGDAAALGCRVLEAELTDERTLEQAEVARARMVLIVSGDDRANLEAAITARQANPTASVVVRLFDQMLARRVERVFDIQALSAAALASPAYVSAATEEAMVAACTIDGHHLSIFTGYQPKSEGACGVITLCKQGTALAPCERQGDEDPASRLMVFLRHADQASPRIGRRRVPSHGASPSWRALLAPCQPRRFWSNLVEMWTHAADITRSLLVSLLGVLVLSVIVFATVGHLSPLDALYFVVTTMTTIGYGDLNLLAQPPLVKAYGILMMLCGATLLATLYALIAEHVLASRVEFLLGRREVRSHEHTVVVGLGSVGYRVARDLQLLGVEVVAIEAVEDSDNVAAARHHFPVIIGTAARASILEKAGIARAATLIAATDDPMLNLSVALQARERNPSITTIVRTYDVGLAEKFKSFGLDSVISTSAIAAPVFVDVAMMPGVELSFTLAESDLLVVRHRVTERSPLGGRSAREISEALGIAVLLVAPADGIARAATLTTRVQAGETVVVLLARERMGELTPQPFVVGPQTTSPISGNRE